MKSNYCDDEISFIICMSVNLWRVKVVRIVPGFGCGVVERIGRYCYFIAGSLVSPVLLLSLWG